MSILSDEYIDEILSENRELKDEVAQLSGGKAALHLEIERLRGLHDEQYAEIERLQSDLDYMESKRNTVQATLFAALEENERLEAELKLLREAPRVKKWRGT